MLLMLLPVTIIAGPPPPPISLCLRPPSLLASVRVESVLPEARAFGGGHLLQLHHVKK